MEPTSRATKPLRVALVELPAIKLCDDTGRNWTALRRTEPLVSKQILLAQLLASGYEASLVNLKDSEREHVYGTVEWRGQTLRKITVGRQVEECYGAEQVDVWGLTVNYMQERDIACDVIRQLRRCGARAIMVGGSDALAVPQCYLDAGATAVVTDKSGRINREAIDYVAGRTASNAAQHLRVSEDGRIIGRAGPPLSPDDWPIPTPDVVKACLGTQYWEGPIPESLRPIGSVIADLGCDRKCDFCQTPLYKIGYQQMSPATAIRWFAAQRDAGARSVICCSDQFLGRVLWDGGRDDVLEIMAGIRDLGLAVLWGNGLEVKKATRGRGMRGGDTAPDERLCAALWGWDGRAGCYNAYIPGERPLAGQLAYEKLLPWNEHMTLMRVIARTGIPDITYGVIVGLPDDSHETLARLEDALYSLFDAMKEENSAIKFRVTPYAIRPLPNTSQAAALSTLGLLAFDDPAICGGFWTACANTHRMSYAEVSAWQVRLAAVGDMDERWGQGVSGILRGIGAEANTGTIAQL
jgi:hypothetical protein